MYHDQRNRTGRFARSANPSKDALRKRRARAAARKDYVAAPKAARPAAVKGFRSADGTLPSASQARILASQRFSFAPNYIRKDDVRKDGSIAPNDKNPSRRRFGTEAEAKTHAARFVEKEGHIGSFISRLNEKPISWVNEATGLTNDVVR